MTYKERLEHLFLTHLPNECPKPIPEKTFMNSRNWRFDWVIPSLKIAIDFDGYVFNPNKKGGHQTPQGMANDMEKRNEAQIRGWLVLLATQKTIDNRTFIHQLERAIKVRRGDIRYE